jgi:hypothetical protein
MMNPGSKEERARVTAQRAGTMDKIVGAMVGVGGARERERERDVASALLAPWESHEPRLWGHSGPALATALCESAHLTTVA